MASQGGLDGGHSRTLSGLSNASGGRSVHQRNASVGNMMPAMDSGRRIWVRRPGLQPTTVYVMDSDIVDDLKLLVLQKYPTTLAQMCDPADLVIECSFDDGGPPRPQFGSTDRASIGLGFSNSPPVSHNTSNPLQQSVAQGSSPSSLHNNPPAGRSGTNNHASNPQGSPAATPLMIELQPDENVYMFLDHYFPGGMTMNDALLVFPSPTAVEEFYATRPQGSEEDRGIIGGEHRRISSYRSGSLEPTPMDDSGPSPTAPPPGFRQTVLQPPVKKSNLKSPRFANGTSNGLSSATSLGSGGSSASNGTGSVSGNGGSTSSKPKSGSNGVLLLPRQFKLPNQTSEQQHAIQSNEKPLRTPLRHSPPATVARHESDLNANDKQKSPPLVGQPAIQNNIQPDTDTSESAVPAGGQTGEQSSGQHNGKAGGTPGPEVKPPKGHDANSAKGSKKLSMGAALSSLAPITSNLPILEKIIPQVNVLIVEDNVINQKILEAFMRRKHIRCSVARNGREAVEKWRQGGFHLILMDIQLPEMSGIDATKEIRRLEQCNRVGTFSEEQSSTAVLNLKKEDKLEKKLFKSPVIIVALTASSSSADKSEALAAGCNDFLTKPVNLLWLEQKTIEWGCMQALIDFEGWKHWVAREDKPKSTNAQGGRRGRDRSQSRGHAQQSRLKSSQRLKSSSQLALGSGSSPQLQPLTAANSALATSQAASANNTSGPPKRVASFNLGTSSLIPPPAILSPTGPPEDLQRHSSNGHAARGRPLIKETVRSI